MDVEQFIDFVKERPCLYDRKDAWNKNKKEKEKKWKEVAELMEITSELAKSKWRNLKDNYSKHLKGTRTTRGHYLKYLHWAWAPNMEFMKKHLNLSSGIANFDHHLEDCKPDHVDSDQFSSRSDGICEEITTDNQIHFQNQMSQSNDMIPRIHNILQYVDNIPDDGYDGTDLIFLGYAKAMKPFSVRRQANVKLRIAKIITDEEVANYEENSEFHDNSTEYSYLPQIQNDPLSPKISHEMQIKAEDS